jgi:hypothetical protein
MRMDIPTSGDAVGGAGRFGIFGIRHLSPYFNDRLVSVIVTL